jgi:hypothetical protein
MSMDLKDLPTLDTRTAAPASAAVDPEYVAVRIASRRRKRTRMWMAFGALSALIGATWAAGIVTSTSTQGTVSNPSPILVNPAAAGNSRFSGAIAAGPNPLAIGSEGKWGVISADAQVFQINLGANDPTTGAPFAGTYYASVQLLNTLAEPYERLDLQWAVDEGACSGTTDFVTAGIKGMMYVETTDAEVDLSPLTGGTTYCIGIHGLGVADDPAGTYIRKVSVASTPTLPQFGVSLNQTS